MREARAQYFEANGFSTAVYDERVFLVSVGPLTLRFPNPGLLPLHDLHHILTGYGTGLLGEAEISAFELRTGCRSPLVVLLCVGSIAIGLFLSPRRVLRAWRRTHGAMGLYHSPLPLDALLDMDLSALRTNLGIPPNGFAN